MRALGVDPGTGSMDLLLLDDEEVRVIYEESIPRPEITRDPHVLIEKIEALDREYGVDSIAAPSGYGVPFIRDASLEEYIAEATFVHEDDLARSHQIHGLRRVMLEVSKRWSNVYYTPGVIHLPTVPGFRKANKIDMGTADKVFTVAAALYSEVDLLGVPVGDASFIVVEAGLAYTSAIAVEAGRIVDGVGGTSGGPGFLGLGAMDAELAYALAGIEPRFPRHRLFQGGASYYAGISSLEELGGKAAMGDPHAAEAVRMLAEAVVKDVFQLLPVFTTLPRRIYVSGRLFRTTGISGVLVRELERALGKLGEQLEIRSVPRLGRITKEGATGAALLASGYAGGRFSWIVEALHLRESRGSIFDYILLPGVPERAREYFRGVGRDTL